MSVLGYILAVLVGLSLGMLGGGGSILTFPIMRYAMGVDVKPAVAMSLFVVGATSAIGFVSHWRQRTVRLRVAAIFSIPAAISAYFAGALSRLLESWVQSVIFGIVGIIAGVMMWRRAAKAKAHAAAGGAELTRTESHPAFLGLTGVAVGALTGTIGVGGGFLILPALVFAGGLAMHEAVGTSLFAITLTAFSGFAGHLGRDPVDWLLVLGFTLAAAIGVVTGSVLAKRVPAARLQQGFAVLVLAAALYVLIKR